MAYVLTVNPQIDPKDWELAAPDKAIQSGVHGFTFAYRIDDANILEKVRQSLLMGEFKKAGYNVLPIVEDIVSPEIDENGFLTRSPNC